MVANPGHSLRPPNLHVYCVVLGPEARQVIEVVLNVCPSPAVDLSLREPQGSVLMYLPFLYSRLLFWA